MAFVVIAGCVYDFTVYSTAVAAPIIAWVIGSIGLLAYEFLKEQGWVERWDRELQIVGYRVTVFGGLSAALVLLLIILSAR